MTIEDLRRSRRLTLGIVLAGILLRCGALGLRWNAEFTSESMDYFRDASELLESDGPLLPRRPVGLPLLMAAVLRVTGGNDQALRLIPFFFGVTTLLALAALALRFCPKGAAVGVAMVAFSPAQILDSVKPLTQTPVGCCALLLIALLSATPGTAARGAAQGAVAGLLAAGATFLRTTGASLIVLPWFGRRTPGWAVRAVAAAILFLVLVGSFAARNARIAGSFVGMNTLDGKNLFYGNNHYTPLYKTWVQANRVTKATNTKEERDYLKKPYVPGDPARTAKNYRAAAAREIGEHPGAFLIRSANRVRCWFGFDTNAGATFIHVFGGPKPIGLAIVGVEVVLWTGAGLLALAALVPAMAGDDPLLRDVVRMPALGVLLILAPYAVSFSHPTYHGAAVPLVAFLAAAGADVLSTRPGILGRRRIAWFWASTVFVLVQVEWFFMMVDRV